MKKFLQRLRVFKRIRVLEQRLANTHMLLVHTRGNHEERIDDIEKYFASREPCTGCGHHRYRQKTLHNGCVK